MSIEELAKATILRFDRENETQRKRIAGLEAENARLIEEITRLREINNLRRDVQR